METYFDCLMIKPDGEPEKIRVAKGKTELYMHFNDKVHSANVRKVHYVIKINREEMRYTYHVVSFAMINHPSVEIKNICERLGIQPINE